jgi:hypothetical protein
MTTTFKNHEEFINWGNGVVGESEGCWAWVEGRMSETKDKFYWFARCFGAQYYGDDAPHFEEAEWAKTLSHLKAVYLYYFGEEMPNGLNETHPNHALVLDAFNAITCDAQWCVKCGDYRFWGTDGDKCAECEKCEGEKCECGREFCRCGEGGTETPDDESECDCDDPDCLVCDAKDDHCEMCKVRTDREEWFDASGNAILYCEDCYNRMAERKREKEAFNRTQSWWGHRVSTDDCGVKVIYDPETEGWLTAEDSCLDCGYGWDCCECDDPDYSLPKKIKQEATDEQIEEAEHEYYTWCQELRDKTSDEVRDELINNTAGTELRLKMKA